MRRTLGRGWWGDLAGVAVLAACLLVEAALAGVGIDDLDEGYFAEQAVRVTRGELPYRDFDSFYTPGLLAVNAAVFALVGEPSLVAMRVVTLAGRAALALGLYALGRQVTRPAFAVLAPLVLLLGLTETPDQWRPNPGWWSAALAVWTAVLLGAAPAVREGRRPGLLALVGVGVGGAFLFKQSLGAYLGAAAAGMVLLQGLDTGRGGVTRSLRVVQNVALVGVLGGVAWTIAPFATLGVVAYLFAPLVVVGIRLGRTHPVCPEGRGVGAVTGEIAALAGGFLLATLPWLVPLLVAMAGHTERLVGFVGVVNQAVLYWPLEVPDGRVWPVLTLSIAVPVAAGARRWAARVGAGVATLAAMAWTLGSVWVPGEEVGPNLLEAPGRAGQGLVMLLAPAAAWAGVWLAWKRPHTAREWRVRWILVAGSFSFLGTYPRLHSIHLAWSAGMLLVLGAAALERAHGWLTRGSSSDGRRWRRAAVYVSLLVLPGLAVLPMLYRRASALVVGDPVTGLPAPRALAPLAGLTGADGLVVRERIRDELLGVVHDVQARTETGEAIFVYPTSPLLYVLAERPNPTRFGHLYPGAATPAEVAEVIAALEARAVRLVVISDFWLDGWGPNLVRTGVRTRVPEDNLPLEWYLAEHFEDAARYGPYRVLTRREAAPPDAR